MLRDDEWLSADLKNNIFKHLYAMDHKQLKEYINTLIDTYNEKHKRNVKLSVKDTSICIMGYEYDFTFFVECDRK